MSLFDMCCPRKPKKSLDYVIKWVEDTDKTIKELEVWKNTIDSNISELVAKAIEEYPWDTLPDEALSHKADKVENAIEGHFASLDSNGNLQDSNYNYNSFAPSIHSHSEIKAPEAFANYAYARIAQSGASVPAFELKVGGANDMSAQVEVNVNNIENLQRALRDPSTTPEDDDTKLITSKAVYNAVIAPREDIRNEGSRVRCKYDEDEGKSSIKFYVQDDDSLEEFEAEINTENIDNLNRALATPSSIPENNANKLITSKAVYDALALKKLILVSQYDQTSAETLYPITQSAKTALQEFVDSVEADKTVPVIVELIDDLVHEDGVVIGTAKWGTDETRQEDNIRVEITVGRYKYVHGDYDISSFDLWDREAIGQSFL